MRHYAEPGTAAAEEIPFSEPWQQVVVIPVCNEKTGILRPLPGNSGRTLMIIVINETETAEPEVSLANEQFSAEVNTRFLPVWKSRCGTGLSLFQDSATPRDVLLVDRFSKGLRYGRKAGVGHARRTGADIACYLIRRQRVCSPWIHCTDADVRLPPHYFSCITAFEGPASRGTAALIYPFRHCDLEDGESCVTRPGSRSRIERVTLLYEYSLRYYVAGLGFAGSPYAYHTIGSTIAVNAAHYAKVRGFPRRQAGEDFYLLNKLAKVGAIRQLHSAENCEPVDIAVRRSDRVPFGTGAAVGRMMELENPAHEYLFYHPSVFHLLRHWLEAIPTFWQSGSREIEATLSHTAFTEPRDAASEPARFEFTALVDGLEKYGARAALQHAFRQSSDEGQFNQQIHTWFDAFRTLKLIHYLRDRCRPSISFEKLAAEPHLDRLLLFESGLPELHQELCREWLNLA